MGACFNNTNAQHDIRFSENKGQWGEQVLFHAGIPSGAVFLEENSILFHFRDDEFLKTAHSGNRDFKAPEFIQHHAFRIRFVGANDFPESRGLHPGEDYENYFIGKNPKKWASRVQNFESLEYKDLYPGIDLIVHGKEYSLKYDFKIHRGSKPDDIIIAYEGLKSIDLKKGDLFLKTSLNEIVEMKPVAYQMDGKDTIFVDCKFRLRKDQVTFKFPRGYDNNLDLIIDPHLVFSTYSGSTADNWGFTATFDSKGNVYSGGIVANVGYPVNIGAFQDTFASGRWDVALIKYDSTGTQRLWASYLGGSGDEMPHSLVVDSNDNLLVLGTTGSDNFPVDANAYDTTFNGGGYLVYANAIKFDNGVDIFITKINETGTQIIASTYVGGTDNDGINFRTSYVSYLQTGNDSLYFNYGDGARGEIICDANNSVYVGSCTFSDDFPTQNPFQPSFGGRQDGVVFKMTANLDNLIWSSYLGGAKDDAIYSIDVSDDGKAYVAGGTSSADLPITAGVVFSEALGGSADGFVSIIQPNGGGLLASSYFGTKIIAEPNPANPPNPSEYPTYTNIYDQVYFVRIDEDKKVYITGQTRAPGSALIINDPQYNQPNSGQFIAKLTENLDSIEWSTVFGSGDGNPDISITAFAVGLNGKIFLSGWGREWVSGSWYTFQGIKNMETTATAYQTESDGQDFYVMVISDDASCLEYASFFGEQHYTACGQSGRDHVDGGTSRFDKNGFIYQAACASCGGCQKFPVLPNPGAWSTTNKAANCNNAVFKFGFESPEYLPDVHRCNSESVHLGSPYISYDPDLNYAWSPGNLLDNASIYNPVPNNLAMAASFELVVSEGFCSTTYYQNFYQHNLALEVPEDQVICDTDSLYLTAEVTLGQAEVVWSANRNYTDTLNPSSPSFYVHPQTNVTYYCKVENEYCTLEDSVHFTVHNVSVNAEDDFTICFGDTVVLNAISVYSGQNIDYVWTPQEAILEGANTGTPSIFIDETTVFTVYAINTSLTDCEDNDVITVYISPFSMTTEEIILEEIDSIFETQSVIVATQTPTHLTYHWHSALAMDDSTKTRILATPEVSGYYNLTVTDEYGCWRKDSIFIFVEDVYCNEDQVYVPNAFSPNNDTKNDLLMVQSRMTNDIYFAVYNRWGQKVFETTQVGFGWDGTYKGKPEPEGVFVYYLKSTCWDGSSFEKKGNVTLLR